MIRQMTNTHSMDRNGQLQRMPHNSSVVSAAPPSHPPVLSHYAHRTGFENAAQLEGSKTNNNTAANSTNGGSKTAAQRSLSRARQFGKDLTNNLTNMFSFTRNPSRQSTKNNSGGVTQV